MVKTSIQEHKLELIQWLSVIEDASLLDSLAELKEQSVRDLRDEIFKVKRGFDLERDSRFRCEKVEATFRGERVI